VKRSKIPPGVGESGMLFLHSGSHYGPGTSRQCPDYARHPNCDIASESFAQRLSAARYGLNQKTVALTASTIY
jgi:hypothetical protein